MASIAEITGVKGDADIGAGTAGSGVGAATVIPVSNAAQFIQNAAMARAEFNKYVTDKHEKKIADTINDLDKIDLKDVLSSDLPAIGAKYSALMKDMQDNLDVVANPNIDHVKSAQLREQRADLNRDIMTSKAHNSILDEHKKALLLHPDLNTDENQAFINNFVKTPMQDRKDFLLKTPSSYDPNEYAKIAAANSVEKVDKDHLSPGKTYIINEKGEYYNADDFVNKFRQVNASTVKNGKSGLDEFREIYNKMPADENGYKPTFDQAVRETALAHIPKNTTAVTIKPNQAKIAQDNLAEEYWSKKQDVALGYARLAQDDKALKANEIKPEEGAEAKYLALYNALQNKGLNYEFGQNIYGSDPKQDITVQVGGDIARDADGKPIPGQFTPLTKQIIPKRQFVSAVQGPGGGLKVTYNENSLDATGKIVSKPKQEIVDYNQAQSDFNRIYGNKFTTQIASGSSSFNKKKLKSNNPVFENLDSYFKQSPIPGTQPTPATGTPAPSGGGMSESAYQQYLKKHGLVK